ncbi:MAG: hypothetical protein QM692_04745 [Thermomicrobiales bacterium]
MIVPAELPTPSLPALRSQSFASWRGRLDREQTPAVVAIAGSRGKTSVLRAAEAIFAHAGLRTATRSSGGVEIEGQSQRGEITPWARALTRLRAGGLDVALQEIDWATVPALTNADIAYPVLAVSNLCANNDACLATPDTAVARKALARMKAEMQGNGKLILNAHDFALANSTDEAHPDHYMVGMTPDAPMLRRHLSLGGNACYLQGNAMLLGEAGQTSLVTTTDDTPWLRHGSVPFAVQNALMAAAIGRAAGLSLAQIAGGLAAYTPQAAAMPGSFNIFDIGAATVIVDRPMPSWFLRPAVRAAASIGRGRQLRVIGPMLNVPSDDLSEIGRLLGRQHGAIITHGDWPQDRLAHFRLGAAMNDVPPVFMQAADERRAIMQGLDMLRTDDVLLVLAENAPSAVRLVAGRSRRLDDAEPMPAGAA